MKRKSMLMLLVTAGCLIIAAFVTSLDRHDKVSDEMGGKIFPDLPVNDISKIILRSADNAIVLERTGAEWIVSSLYGVSADFERIRSMLIDIMNLEKDQKLDLAMKQKEELNLIMPDEGKGEADSAGLLVEMMGKDDVVMASLLLGKERPSKETGRGMRYNLPDGRYVSPNRGTNVYLVSDNLYDVSSDPVRWASTEILDINSFNVKSVSIRGEDRDDVDVQWEGENEEPVLRKKKRREKLDENSVRAVREGLSYLRFSGVADPELSDHDLGMDEPVTFSALTKDGLIYAVKVGSANPSGDGNYIRVSAEISPDFDEIFVLNQSDEELDGNEEGSEDKQENGADQARAEAEKQISAFNERFSSRTFIIPSYKAEVLSYDRDDMIAKDEDE